MKSAAIKLWMIGVVSILFYACGSQPEQKSTQEEKQSKEVNFDNERAATFYQNLSSLCGKSFSGKETYVKEGRESWAHLPMVMHVTVCNNDELHIPFHVGDDRSRTWMFFNEDGKLRFRHDHRHEDGTPEDLTMYGGYANNEGTQFRQEFPADEYTIDVHPRSEGAVWIVSLSTDMTCFCYQLFHHGELLFQADFDLTTELE